MEGSNRIPQLGFMKRIFLLTIISIVIGFIFYTYQLRMINLDNPNLDNPIILKHCNDYFTQGLYFYGNRWFKTSGLYNMSSLGIFDEQFNLLETYNAPPDTFYEGCCVIPEHKCVLVLTWKEDVAYCYSIEPKRWMERTIVSNFNQLIDRATNDSVSEGWGVTYYNSHLYCTNGTNRIAILSVLKNGFKPINYLTLPRSNLNEIEIIPPYIYCNVWNTTLIISTHLETHVSQIIDLTNIPNIAELVKYYHDPSTGNVLNGIGRDKLSNMIVTGKRWPISIRINTETFDSSRLNKDK